jgi:hypothetical protein
MAPSARFQETPRRFDLGRSNIVYVHFDAFHTAWFDRSMPNVPLSRAAFGSWGVERMVRRHSSRQPYQEARELSFHHPQVASWLTAGIRSISSLLRRSQSDS